jgi:hypothetical protein
MEMIIHIGTMRGLNKKLIFVLIFTPMNCDVFEFFIFIADTCQQYIWRKNKDHFSGRFASVGISSRDILCSMVYA